MRCGYVGFLCCIEYLDLFLTQSCCILSLFPPIIFRAVLSRPFLTRAQPCPVPCELSAWSSFTDCTAPCGGGTRRQSRFVMRPAAYNGKPCETQRERYAWGQVSNSWSVVLTFLFAFQSYCTFRFVCIVLVSKKQNSVSCFSVTHRQSIMLSPIQVFCCCL